MSMTTQLETVVTGFTVVAASAFGSKFACFTAEVTSAPMPEWMTWLVGPLGALAGLIIALMWMNKRLDRTESKAEAKETARDAQLREERDRLIVALEQSTVAHHDVKEVMEGVKAVIGNCQARAKTPT
jgi:hypothetical protein